MQTVTVDHALVVLVASGMLKANATRRSFAMFSCNPEAVISILSIPPMYNSLKSSNLNVWNKFVHDETTWNINLFSRDTSEFNV